MRVKYRTPADKMEKIPYLDCDEVYVGKTCKMLHKMTYEHKQMVKYLDQKNGIAVHVAKYNHWINWYVRMSDLILEKEGPLSHLYQDQL